PAVDESEIITLGLNLTGLRIGSNKNKLKFGSTIYYKRNFGQLIYGKQNFFNGSIGIITEQFSGKCTSGDVPSLNIHNIDTWFLYHFLARSWYYQPKEMYASGTGSKRIHQETLLKFDITCPATTEEQYLIGLLIQKIISSISLHQREWKVNKNQHFYTKMLNKLLIIRILIMVL
uniref:restriction endonuclease subunit S n=1 Tax=Mycoplasma simbae TaxID=36744 RepID=UPI0004983971